MGSRTELIDIINDTIKEIEDYKTTIKRRVHVELDSLDSDMTEVFKSLAEYNVAEQITTTLTEVIHETKLNHVPPVINLTKKAPLSPKRMKNGFVARGQLTPPSQLKPIILEYLKSQKGPVPKEFVYKHIIKVVPLNKFDKSERIDSGKPRQRWIANVDCVAFKLAKEGKIIKDRGMWSAK